MALVWQIQIRYQCRLILLVSTTANACPSTDRSGYTYIHKHRLVTRVLPLCIAIFVDHHVDRHNASPHEHHVDRLHDDQPINIKSCVSAIYEPLHVVRRK
jgi:hypothetical protein